MPFYRDVQEALNDCTKCPWGLSADQSATCIC